MMAPGMDKRYFERHRFPKWSGTPTVLQEPRLMARVFPELTKTDHERLAYKFKHKAEEASRVYQAALDAAIKKHGERQGALVSGIYSAHFPESVKTELRALAPLKGIYMDAALSHWKAAGKRSRLF